ncbi:MBL fold metallo-hydrolase [Crenobacter sp. SG2305]|uniref:MBL fold metallo-hydrolase n=1 Tax=Crenobacter oryzisoli TaxID=3056844 RepID=UPI0025AA379C|nr:MBL fold metallo-hydrolase [Crenobacter sp. SG2305]MDN0084428.1 MBL fold metallo-hydrolase [Crenobacter sp. SG2305]
MTQTVDLTILGCGSSSGTPAIGCSCPTCTSPDPKNRRTRCSAYLKVNGLGVLIDTGPDLRQQALREGITQVDMVLYTHPHADHLNGIDDLRAFCYVKKGAVHLFGNEFTMNNITERFGYTLSAPTPQWDMPVLLAKAVSGPFEFGDVMFTPIPLEHGSWPCAGWRVGNVAWLTDLSAIPETSLALLDGLEVLFLDCLRNMPYKSHLGVEQSFEWAERIGAKRTVLIHMTHGLEYHELSSRCPTGIEVGYDGLSVSVPLPT